MAQWPGFGMPVLALLSPGKLWPQMPLLGLSLLAWHRVLQRPVGHTMTKPLRIHAGTHTEVCQRLLARAAGKQLCSEPSEPPLSARNPSNRQHLSSPWQSKKRPTFLRSFQYFIFLLPVRRTGTRDHIAGEKEVSEGQGTEGCGAPSLGGQREGWVKAEEHIQYQWPWIYLEKMFLILSQMLPSVTLTLSEKLGREEMGREGKKEAQNQHKNRNIKVSFS